ncbi:FUSC family protein [Marinobacterium mangrovicola]|uniref:Fusaric acid resistance family protein n=1 Tax=Marinobacterium mangrovicola TaxID=1476959 RepID=A0A4R1G8X3_9GAMM|nr:FUSC family protein [Marinobacterium mangrovicola]TCK04078.1 fusaric acid resistance family protein [Marinobacterium mangrovicola]
MSEQRRFSAARQMFTDFFRINQHARPWHLPVMTGLCAMIPALIGSFYGAFSLGVIGCLGAMVFIYIPQANLGKRLFTLLMVAIGFQISYFLSATSSDTLLGSTLILFLITLVMTLVVRVLQVALPGRFFFVLVAITATLHAPGMPTVEERMLILGLGSLTSIVGMLVYHLLVPVNPAAGPGKLPPNQSADDPWIATLADGLCSAVFVALTFYIASELELLKPYWATIACAAILQGNSLRHMWQRQAQRIVGTAMGLGVAWLLFSFQPSTLVLAIAIGLFNFAIQSLVVRNYALALVFITPMTLIFSEASSLQTDLSTLMEERFVETVLGSLIGFIGGWVLHRLLKQG